LLRKNSKKAFQLEKTVLQRGHFCRQMQKRQRGNQLHERRMFGIQAEIAVLPGHIARVDVLVLIPRERIAMNGKREWYPKNGHPKHNGDHPGSAARAQSIPSRFPHSGAIRH